MEKECHINDLQIVLTDRKSIYQSGDCVNGNVILSLNGTLLAGLLRIKLTCLAEVCWDDSTFLKHDNSHVQANFTYFEEDFQMSDHDKDRVLTDGINKVPFVFQLPESGISGTFEGIYGSIIYLIEAFVERHHESTMTEVRVEVEAPIRDNLMLSMGGSTQKELSFYNFGHGHIDMHAYVLKKGYRRGENFEVICIIINNSSTCVRARASLHQIQQYMVEDKHKTVESVVSVDTFGDKVDSDERRMSAILMTVPEGIPLSLKSDNIDVKYLVHVTLDIPHAFNLHINLPIIITNIYALSKA